MQVLVLPSVCDQVVHASSRNVSSSSYDALSLRTLQRRQTFADFTCADPVLIGTNMSCTLSFVSSVYWLELHFHT